MFNEFQWNCFSFVDKCNIALIIFLKCDVTKFRIPPPSLSHNVTLSRPPSAPLNVWRNLWMPRNIGKGAEHGVELSCAGWRNECQIWLARWKQFKGISVTGCDHIEREHRNLSPTLWLFLPYRNEAFVGSLHSKTVRETAWFQEFPQPYHHKTWHTYSRLPTSWLLFSCPQVSGQRGDDHINWSAEMWLTRLELRLRGYPNKFLHRSKCTRGLKFYMILSSVLVFKVRIELEWQKQITYTFKFIIILLERKKYQQK